MIATVLGILISLVIGAIGILITLRTVRRTSLSYVQFDMLSLFRSIVKDMGNIKVLYQDTPIEPGLFLLRGAIVNSGNNDIDKSTIYQPLKMGFPVDLVQIVECNTPSSTAIPEIVKNENCIVFKWDLLKKGELVPFNILLKLTNMGFRERKLGEEPKHALDDVLFEKLTFAERIKDLDRTKKEKRDELQLTRTRFDTIQRVFAAVSFALFLLVVGVFVFSGSRYGIAFTYLTGDAKEIVAHISFSYDGRLSIKQMGGPFREQKDVDSFDTTLIKGVVRTSDWLNIFSVVALILLLLGVSILLTVQDISKARVRKRYKHLLDIFK